MTEFAFFLAMTVGALVAAGLVAVGIAAAGSAWKTTKLHPMVLFVVAVLFAAAINTLVSGRDFSVVLPIDDAAPASDAPHPLSAWVSRFTSLFIVLAALERIVHAWFSGVREPRQTPRFLLAAFLVYWVCSVALPVFLGAHPQVKHEYFYTLFLGFGTLLLTPQDSQRSVVLARNAFLAFVLISFALIPVRPDLVVDAYYTQGLFGNHPRFAGLAAHANVLGPFCVLGLLFLWAEPFRHRGLNVMSWIVLLGALVFTQSKTSWASFFICTCWMLAWRESASMRRWLAEEAHRWASAALLVILMLGIAGLSLFIWVADFSTAIDAFLHSRIGNQVSTMTGRDLIWETAIKEWQAHPVFGYGPGLFDEFHRKVIGMNFATHGHNQVLDTLARSGLVGLAGLIVFFLTLFSHALRAASRTGGLSMALLIVLIFLAIGEVPLNIMLYGPENLAVWLLIMVLCGYTAARQRPEPERIEPSFGQLGMSRPTTPSLRSSR